MKPTEIGAGLSGPSGEKVVSQLLLGDCVQLLGGLQDNSIDCILIDPPYGINYKSLSHKLPKVTIINDGFEAYALLDKALAAAHPKLKDGCWAFIFTNWKAYPSMAAITERYFPIKNLLIWEKNAWTRGDMRGNWGYQHELVMAARKGETKIRRLLNGKREGNILKYKKLPTNYMVHPTEKPIEMLKYLIEKSTNPGDTVLDFFMGSASCGAAAKQANRNFIGMEIDPVWFKVAQERLDAA